MALSKQIRFDLKCLNYIVIYVRRGEEALVLEWLISGYDQEILKSKTADKHVAL